MAIKPMRMNEIKGINNPLFGIIALFTLFIIFNVPVMTTLWRHSFDDGTYSHAYLIPFITLYLYHQLKDEGLLAYQQSFSWLKFSFFALACYALYVAAAAQISLGYWLASLAVIITAIIMLYQYHWRIIFPAAFLILIIPIWGTLTTILQSMSVKAVNYMMGYTGIPTYVEGNFVSIPAGTFEIAGGCSGLRYFIVALAISALYIFLNMRKKRNILLFLSFAIIGALVTNWIRITLLIVIGQYTNMTSELMTDHNNFGWYVFIPFMVLLILFGNYLADAPVGKPQSSHKNSTCTLNTYSTLVIVIGLLLSSTSITNGISNEHKNVSKSLAEYRNQQKLEPFIPYYSNSQMQEISVENIKVSIHTFEFSGADLDAKPSFYQNRNTPDKWKIIDRIRYGQWHIIEIVNKRQHKLVATSFQLNNQLFAQRKQFKIARLKAGLIGEKATKLHWLSVNCQESCVDAQIDFEQVLNNLSLTQ